MRVQAVVVEDRETAPPGLRCTPRRDDISLRDGKNRLSSQLGCVHVRHRRDVGEELGRPLGEELVAQVRRRAVVRRRLDAVDQVAQRHRLAVDLDLEVAVSRLEELRASIGPAHAQWEMASVRIDRPRRTQVLALELLRAQAARRSI